MRALRPLRRSAYRRLAAALALSVLAEGLWTLSVVWQVIELGGGPGALSLVSGALALGVIVTALLGGVLADRIPQKRILVGVMSVLAVSIGLVAALSATGALSIPLLVVVAAAIGLSMGLFFPAYSALVPAMVDDDELLAVNGLEGVVRPVLLQGAGPALAGALVAAYSPAAALAATAVACVAGLVAALALPRRALRRDLDEGSSGVGAVVRDLVEGFRYMVATRWLLVTLVFASAMVLLVLGPLEVLVPFAIIENAGGGPGGHSLVLLAHGAGGAIASILVASLRLPRRYLTVMIAMWTAGCVPMVVFGLVDTLWPMIVAGFVVGGLFSAPQVIWGTLLQRRVPPALLGRVTSLDFFVSLAFMPVSMTLAGPVSEVVGLTPVFLAAGLAPLVFGVLALVLGRLGPDEIAHPLDVAVPDDDTTSGEPRAA
ncbi:putative MFS family arabinose efflux permease [Actinomycetospora succinea]|uniref:Putative MFS family arabinose efflux permease n=1 Tax=Actinomycetospora succinea TaxID=663603 RepID=A0A4R6VIM5_9PSEU|nr:MFS transporter [Actinomycetospora succinea]TDQ63117.1 putative MFS family arabinose efflux permease [Actinomycetospora succinea]